MVGGHAWQGACVGGMCGRGCVHGRGLHGRAACMEGGCVWGVRRHALQGGGVPGRYYEIWSMSERYASYWNAFLFSYVSQEN